MQFVTMVRLRPGATGILPAEREPGIYELEWSRLSKHMQLVGARIQMMLNVLGVARGPWLMMTSKDPRVYCLVGGQARGKLRLTSVQRLANVCGGMPRWPPSSIWGWQPCTSPSRVLLDGASRDSSQPSR